MLNLSRVTLVVAAAVIAGLVGAPRAFACNTDYWNVGCQNYSVGESHSAYPGATPGNIYVRVSADANAWFYGKTKGFVSNAQGSWIWSEYAIYPDTTFNLVINFSNSRGGCVNSSSTGGTIWINCATHLGS